jgi:hypothetical protein
MWRRGRRLIPQPRLHGAGRHVAPIARACWLGALIETAPLPEVTAAATLNLLRAQRREIQRIELEIPGWEIRVVSDVGLRVRR